MQRQNHIDILKREGERKEWEELPLLYCFETIGMSPWLHVTQNHRQVSVAHSHSHSYDMYRQIISGLPLIKKRKKRQTALIYLNNKQPVFNKLAFHCPCALYAEGPDSR